MQERLWLSLFLADLADPAAVTRLAVDHCLAPARAAWGLPAPVAGEGDSAFFFEIEPINGVRAQQMREHYLRVSAAHFDPVVRGLLLFGWMFPGATMGTESPDGAIQLPGPAFLSDSQMLAYRTHEEVEYLAAGLLGQIPPAPMFHGMNPYTPVADPAILGELARIQGVLGQAVGKPEDLGDYRRIDLGLHALDQFAAAELDDILRKDVHQRLVWLASWEEADPDNQSPVLTPSDLITFDRGSFLASVPESLAGLVALDFAESLRLDRMAGRCARCDRPMLLNGQRSARAKRGKPIFHDDCHREHRLSYWRDYQAGRLPRGGPNDGAEG
jgi:hypothetical protein